MPKMPSSSSASARSMSSTAPLASNIVGAAIVGLVDRSESMRGEATSIAVSNFSSANEFSIAWSAAPFCITSSRSSARSTGLAHTLMAMQTPRMSRNPAMHSTISAHSGMGSFFLAGGAGVVSAAATPLEGTGVGALRKMRAYTPMRVTGALNSVADAPAETSAAQLHVFVPGLMVPRHRSPAASAGAAAACWAALNRCEATVVVSEPSWLRSLATSNEIASANGETMLPVSETATPTCTATVLSGRVEYGASLTASTTAAPAVMGVRLVTSAHCRRTTTAEGAVGADAESVTGASSTFEDAAVIGITLLSIGRNAGETGHDLPGSTAEPSGHGIEPSEFTLQSTGFSTHVPSGHITGVLSGQ
eukprot:comp22362_c0_seq1/m.54082 comp22362_c0_seq1/g.54082  ORF comp22362_c0_seq1/g.54082 comp22362_c0_seq1/m.54082 type:complete len:363 (+) comp22362_c0_seq1:205-1293(+)